MSQNLDAITLAVKSCVNKFKKNQLLCADKFGCRVYIYFSKLDNLKTIRMKLVVGDPTEANIFESLEKRLEKNGYIFTHSASFFQPSFNMKLSASEMRDYILYFCNMEGNVSIKKMINYGSNY